MNDKCYNCGNKPDTEGHEDPDSGYMVRVWSVKRQEESWLCYGCFISLLDSDHYRKLREIMQRDNEIWKKIKK